MSLYEHDRQAIKVANIVRAKFYPKMTISNVATTFPKPDFILMPRLSFVSRKKTKTPIAFEFKPSYCSRREIFTGIGQVLSYNFLFPFAYLIVPSKTFDGFDVKSFLDRILKTSDAPPGFMVYDPQDLEQIELVKEARHLDLPEEEIRSSIGVSRSYSYWREVKPSEVAKALSIILAKAQRGNGSIKDSSLDELWKEVLSHRFPRAMKPSSFLVNYKLFFDQNGLWDKEGKPTSLGVHLHSLCESRAYHDYENPEVRDLVAYVMLRFGGHLELLMRIFETQREASPRNLGVADRWFSFVVKTINNQGYFVADQDLTPSFPRLQTAYGTYLAIVSKPWFRRLVGLDIDWKRMIEVLTNGTRVFEPVERELV